MIMFIVLGLLDTIVAALMIATHLNILNEWRIAIMAAVYLVGKGIMMSGSFLSVLDIIIGIYFILIMLGVRTLLVYAFALILVYKFVTSLIMRG